MRLSWGKRISQDMRARRSGLARLARARSLAHAAAAMALAFASCLAVAPSSASAQEDLIKKSLGVDKGQPLLLQADEMIYDRQNNRVVARGNVEVYYNKYSLLSDELIYDQRVNTLSAVGNVRIKEPDGAVIKADRITLTDDFREGFIRSLRIVTKDESRIAAARAYRAEGETTVFESGAYTPCALCKDSHPDDAPIWQIKARKIIHKKSEGNIYYKDATLELWGLPVAWVPYFYHPDPTVKRRSGFLAPTFRQSDNLGFAYEQPYYFALAPNYDLTLAPVITTDAGILVKADWRHRLESGAYRIRIAAAYDDDPDPDAPTDQEFRGSIETQGKFRLGSFWTWGWDVTVDTDDTFRRFYKLDKVTQTDRVNDVFLIGQSDRNYFGVHLYQFTALSDDDAPYQESLVHPVIDYNYIFGEPVLGGELSWDTNVVALTRDDGGDSSRLTTEVKWRRTLTGPLGQRFTPFAQARMDLYRVSSYEDQVTAAFQDEDTFGRHLLTGGIDYRYPFVKHTPWASHVIEPIAQIITRTDAQHSEDPPVEDAQSLVFDDTLLFDIDKFSGYDRLETGTRANVGVQYTLQTHFGASARAVFGQSYHIAGDNPFPDDTGLETDRSDYVAGFYFDVASHFRLLSQMRFDEGDFSVRRTDVQVAANYGPLQAAVTYVDADAQPGLGIYEDREELYASAVMKLTDSWTMFGNVRYNLEEEETVEHAVGLKYSSCECFVLSVKYEESSVDVDDIEPEQSVLVRFEFKDLGSVDLKTDNIDGFAATDEKSD